MSPHGGPNTSLADIRMRSERQAAPARAHLLAATKVLLDEASLDNISVYQILREAGVSRPTFYSYFASKLEIVIELYTLAGADVHAAVRPMYERPDEQTPTQAIHNGIKDLVTAWMRNCTVFYAVVEHRYTMPEMMAKSQEQIAYSARHIAAQLDRDRAVGIAPQGPPSGTLVTTLLWSSEHILYIAGRGLDKHLADEHAAIETLHTMWLGTLYESDIGSTCETGGSSRTLGR